MRSARQWLPGVLAVLRPLGPRRPGPARVWATGMVAVPTLTFVGNAVVNHRLTTADVACGAVLSLVTLLLVLLPEDRAPALCFVGLVVGTIAIVVLDLATQDAKVTGQVFFCLPVLYAGIHLRVAGVVVTTVIGVLGEAVVVLNLLPIAEAVQDLVFLSALMVLVTAALARSAVLQERLVDRLRQQAAIDPLTGLVTRRVLDDATSCAITGTDQNAGTALVLLDVDKFKHINDTYGHVVGDDALHHVAALLTASSRGQDVVARMGGDELAVLMPGCTYEVALRRAQDFVDVVMSHPLQLPNGEQVTLSISAGAAHAPEHAGDPRDLYSAADGALYVAKRGGRGRVGHVVPATAR